MKNFIVSARKYRPAVFEHVLGQPHITTTLKNAIKDKHVAQAFLFCGPRGVGKTTCARILAKTINCQQVTADIEPCNACPSCTSANYNNSFNIYELDAASNNSVEDIRALVDQVRYPPQVGKYKVYIIDEVHMLSNAAFNAFLKTLEEPPSHVIFILATTEKHKIIPTILSRCQIFDFRRIQPQDMVQQLKHIADQEGITYEDEALHLISQKADGALRDALSIFDLIVTFASGKSLTYQATLENLHILDYEYYFKLIDACLQGNTAQALLLYDQILKAGFDGHHFITGLSEHLRNLLVCQDTATLELLEAVTSVKEKYKTQAAAAGLPFLFKALNIINQYDIHYKSSNNKRLHVELALIELVHLQVSPHAASTIVQTQIPSTAKNQVTLVPVSRPEPPSNLPKAIQKDKVAHTNPAEPFQQPDTKPGGLQPTIKLPQIDQLKKGLAFQEVPVQQPKEVAIQQALTEEAVREHWQQYVQKLKEAGKMTEYSVLNQAIGLEGATIVVTLVNSVQQDILAGIKEGLIADLRKKLQHTGIELKEVVVPIQRNKKPYTAQEKFKYLAEKYPAVHMLQEKLRLEVQD